MKKTKFVIGASVLLILSFIGQSIVAQETETTTPKVETLNNTHYVPDDFPTIQAAIDSNEVKYFDTIIVRSGTYTLDEELVIHKPIKLIGEDKETTIIEVNGYSVEVIQISASFVTVSGFTVRNGDYAGIYVYSGYIGVKITNNIITDCKMGIEIWDSNCNTVSNNIVTNNEDAGIFICEASFNKVVGNVVENNYKGIELVAATGNFIGDSDDNTLKNQLIGNHIGIEIGVFSVYLDETLEQNNLFEGNDYDIHRWWVPGAENYGGNSPTGQLINILPSSL